MALHGLAAFLEGSADDLIVLTFGAIEELEGRPLPASAYKHAAFWSNSSTYARAWRDAGFTASRRGMPSGHIAFERTGAKSAPTAPTPQADATSRPPLVDDGRTADIILIGCVKTKLDHAAPAQDLYVSAGFRKRRAFAEATGRPWYILSALHGLIAPATLIEPYDVCLVDEAGDYRTAWGEWVAAHLARAEQLAGKIIEIHAGRAYVDACRPGLVRHGAIVRAPLDGLTMGQQLAWYGDAPATFEPGPAPHLATQLADADAAAERFADDGSSAERLLRDRLRALRIDQLHQTILNQAGLYAWWVDHDGARDLSDGLGHPVSGLIYAGQTGADSSRQGIPRASTLRGRLLGNHFRGTVRGSTFRLTLAVALGGQLLDGDGDVFDRAAEARLSEWMASNLAVVPVPVPDRAAPGALEERVLHDLDPPLNLQHVDRTPLRELLKIRRRQLLSAQPPQP